jgi:hypothetical protein
LVSNKTELKTLGVHLEAVEAGITDEISRIRAERPGGPAT